MRLQAQIHTWRGSLAWCLVVACIAACSTTAAQSAASDHGQLLADAAAQDREAQYTLAHLLIKGRGGMAVDVNGGMSWLRQAAAHGHRDAAFDLAVFYLEGKTVDKDAEKSIAWFFKAAELGHVEAQYALGLALLKSDTEAAIVWLEQAAAAGHETAGEELERLCREQQEGCF